MNGYSVNIVAIETPDEGPSAVGGPNKASPAPPVKVK